MPRLPLTADDLARGRQIGAPLGGQAAKRLAPPTTCPRCGRRMDNRTYHAYLGHLGLHGLADRYFAGDLPAAQARLRANALAVQDPAPWNGAWPAYRPIGGSDG
jgi:hypothetical protein